MTDMIPAARQTGLASCIFLFAALLIVPAMAAPPAAQASKPRLASLQIEIWPEYDRPAALVILRGELEKDVSLPAAVTLRIPASSGGPAEVAYGSADKADLLNLPYERSDAKDFITLRFSVPDRFLHVEFYDHFLTGASERKYQYLWPGDLAAGQMRVVVQEPAGASDFSTQPVLGEDTTGANGLHYHGSQLGSFPAGKPLSLEVRYTKPDTRTSAQILNLKTEPAVPETSRQEERGAVSSALVPALGVGLPLVLAALAGFFLWRRRVRAQSDGVASCSRCGKRAKPGDLFCSKCGSKLA